MEDRFSQQLKKGVLELLVLQLICRGPTYGYELILRLNRRSEGFFSLKEGTLYPILYRLEDSGFIRSVWQQETSRKTPRKVYTATAAGQEENARRLTLWEQFRCAVENTLCQEGETEHETEVERE